MLLHLLPFVFLAAPALAQDMTLPAGCTQIVAVQGQSCYLRQLTRCDSDPAGNFRVSVYGADGLLAMSLLDANNSMISVDYPVDRPDGQPGPVADPFDLNALLTTGSDLHDMTVDQSDGSRLAFAGSTKLTGATIMVDGRTLVEVARWEIFTNVDGTSLPVESTMYYDPDLAVLLSARSSGPDGLIYDRMPVDFIFPGEPGALTTRPTVGCAG